MVRDFMIMRQNIEVLHSQIWLFLIQLIQSLGEYFFVDLKTAEIKHFPEILFDFIS